MFSVNNDYTIQIAGGNILNVPDKCFLDDKFGLSKDHFMSDTSKKTRQLEEKVRALEKSQEYLSEANNDFRAENDRLKWDLRTAREECLEISKINDQLFEENAQLRKSLEAEQAKYFEADQMLAHIAYLESQLQAMRIESVANRRKISELMAEQKPVSEYREKWEREKEILMTRIQRQEAQNRSLDAKLRISHMPFLAQSSQ